MGKPNKFVLLALLLNLSPLVLTLIMVYACGLIGWKNGLCFWLDNGTLGIVIFYLLTLLLIASAAILVIVNSVHSYKKITLIGWVLRSLIVLLDIYWLSDYLSRVIDSIAFLFK